jgi:hypothetical protein
MITPNDARKLRKFIVKGAAYLSDEDALEAVELFQEWEVGVKYEVEEVDGVLIKPRVSYNGVLYRVEQTHTSQADWTPDITPALYTRVSKPGEIDVWRQPTGAQDAYAYGAKVHYPTKTDPIYISTVNDNVWPPDVYGWEIWTQQEE